MADNALYMSYIKGILKDSTICHVCGSESPDNAKLKHKKNCAYLKFTKLQNVV